MVLEISLSFKDQSIRCMPRPNISVGLVGNAGDIKMIRYRFTNFMILILYTLLILICSCILYANTILTE